MTSKELIEIVSQISRQNIEHVDQWMRKLSEKQLNWRPNPGIWSINDVLAHLNTYSEYYHPVFSKKIESTRFQAPVEEFSSSPLGRSAWKSMKLGNARNIKRKFRAPKNYNPSLSPELIRPEAVNRFKEDQQELIRIAEESLSVSLRKVKVPVSISKMVRLRLGDALLFVAYHNERHMEQMVNLKKHPNFPKK